MREGRKERDGDEKPVGAKPHRATKGTVGLKLGTHVMDGRRKK
jgi:hypothetical protein